MAKSDDQPPISGNLRISLFHVERQTMVIFQANEHGLIYIPAGTYLHIDSHILITLPETISMRATNLGSGHLLRTSDNAPEVLSPEDKLEAIRKAEEKLAAGNSN